MSYSIILDLDPLKRSTRVERVIAHFDRSHNPSAAYHVELTWLAGSSKVIDQAIQSWARQVSKYGLRLVEVSTREVDSKFNPFQRAALIRMCVAPPDVELDDGIDGK